MGDRRAATTTSSRARSPTAASTSSAVPSARCRTTSGASSTPTYALFPCKPKPYTSDTRTRLGPRHCRGRRAVRRARAPSHRAPTRGAPGFINDWPSENPKPADQSSLVNQGKESADKLYRSLQLLLFVQFRDVMSQQIVNDSAERGHRLTTSELMCLPDTRTRDGEDQVRVGRSTLWGPPSTLTPSRPDSSRSLPRRRRAWRSVCYHSRPRETILYSSCPPSC